MNFLLVFALPSIMRGPRWAGCGLLNLALYGLAMLGKTISVILGAVWILSQDGKQCVSLHADETDRDKWETSARTGSVASADATGVCPCVLSLSLSLLFCPLSPQKPLLPRFYDHAYTYFLVVVIVLCLQFTAGFMYLWKCGLQDAVDEAGDQLRQEALARQARQERQAFIEDSRSV